MCVCIREGFVEIIKLEKLVMKIIMNIYNAPWLSWIAAYFFEKMFTFTKFLKISFTIY